MPRKAVYDYKEDLGNVVVTPQIRCRFMRELPDVPREWHCHDGASEVFLVLEGRVEFRIEDETCVAGPGQLVHVELPGSVVVRVVKVGRTPHAAPPPEYRGEGVKRGGLLLFAACSFLDREDVVFVGDVEDAVGNDGGTVDA